MAQKTPPAPAVLHALVSRWRHLAGWVVTLVLLAIVVIALVLQSFTLQAFRSKLSRLEQSQSGLVDEVGQKLTVADQLTALRQEVNTLRATLSLPPVPEPTPPVVETPPPGEADAESPQVRTARGLFLALDRIAAEQAIAEKATAARTRLDTMRQDADALARLGAVKLVFSPSIVEDGQLISISLLRGKETMRRFTYHRDTDEWEIFADTGATFFKTVDDFDAATRALLDDLPGVIALDASAATLRGEAQALLREPATKTLFDEHALRLVDDRVQNADGKTILALRVVLRDGKMRILVDTGKEATYDSSDALRAALPELLAGLDTRSIVETRVAASQERLVAALADPAFIAALARAGLHMTSEPRIETDRLYYPLLDASNVVVKQIAIERSISADIILVDAEGRDAIPLDDLVDAPSGVLAEAIPSVVPDQPKPSASASTFLLAGKHGSLVDAMVLAHVDPERGTVTLLSVPRDLEINNRKINAIWQSFGMGELTNQLGKLTGYKVDHFVLIDMYAFIDVVDLLGGIDVTLTERLIDPSYRTLDNGVWGTLHYEPGAHHLNGRQALRLARSRHYSTDFARSARQHLLLEGIRDKVRELSTRDASTLASLADIAVQRTETDLTPQEIISFFVANAGVRVRSGATMSTSNVLTSMRKNEGAVAAKAAQCAALPAEDAAARASCTDELATMDKGAYILLPRDGNWALLKWYASKTFEAA